MASEPSPDSSSAAATKTATVLQFPKPSGGVVFLAKGAKGGSVADLQGQLATWGFSPGKVDGVFGEDTANALIALQRKLGVAPTGNFDSVTKSAIAVDLQSATSVIRATQRMMGMESAPGAGANAAGPSASAPVNPSAKSITPWQVGGGIVAALGFLLLKGKKVEAVSDLVDEEVEDIIDDEVIDDEIDDDVDPVVETAPKKRKKRKSKARAPKQPAAVA